MIKKKPRDEFESVLWHIPTTTQHEQRYITDVRVDNTKDKEQDAEIQSNDETN